MIKQLAPLGFMFLLYGSSNAQVNCPPGYEPRNVKCSGAIVSKCIPVDHTCKGCWTIEWQSCKGDWKSLGGCAWHSTYSQCEEDAERTKNGTLYHPCPEVMNKYVYRIYCNESIYCGSSEEPQPILSKAPVKSSQANHGAQPSPHPIPPPNFTWGNFDKTNVLPDWFRNMVSKDVSYNKGLFTYGDKSYKINLEDGAGQLLSIAPVLFANKWVRDKTWELIKGEAVDMGKSKALDGIFASEQSKTNAEIITDGITTGFNTPAVAWFIIKSLTKSADLNKDEDKGIQEDRMKDKFLKQHKEIIIPQSSMGNSNSQFDYVVHRLVIKEIMKQKGVNEQESEKILHATPKIESYIRSQVPRSASSASSGQ